MFKTIEECRLELVAHSVMVAPTEEITMLADGGGGKARTMVDTALQNADWMPCSAARASFGNEDKTGNDSAADRKLMSYLADHQHMTPYEYQHATFLIECPLFIRSQIHRHRTFSYNEISRRYTSEELAFWIPDVCRGQSKSNRQASSGIVTEMYAGLEDPERRRVYEEAMGAPVAPSDPVNHFRITANAALGWYNDLLAAGVAREQARAVLPQSLLTRFYMGGVLRNWQHFIELRRDEHAQYEVQVIANRIAGQLRKLWPESCEALGI